MKIYPNKIITDRLILRPVGIGDVSDIVDNVNNIKVSRYLTVIRHPYTEKDAREWIRKSQKKNRNQGKKLSRISYVIYFQPEKCIVGAIGLHDIDYDVKKTEIGYWLGERYWRNHIMSEALSAMLNLSFNNLKLNRVEAKVFKENVASAKLLEKFGFKKEGILRQAGYSVASKKIYDEEIYSLLKKDYTK